MELVGINGANSTISPISAGVARRDVSGGSPVLLASNEGAADVIELFGTLTANIVVTVPTPIFPMIDGTSGIPFTIVPSWIKIVSNDTTGPFTVTVVGPGGTGVAVPQGSALPLFSEDGVNVKSAGSSGGGPVVGPPLTGAYFNAAGNLVGTPGFISVDPVLGAVYIGQTGPDHGSSSHLQVSSATANAA